MAISIDRVYQKVLALANKEQRGYITPQEFNLFADHAQMDIFEQYFYDLSQFKRLPGNQSEYSDVVSIIKDKISFFEYYFTGSNYNITVANQWGDCVNLREDIPDLYRLTEVHVVYKNPVGITESSIAGTCEQLTPREFTLRNESKLTKPNYNRPVYVKYSSSNYPERIKIWPYPTTSNLSGVTDGSPVTSPTKQAGVCADYIRKPKKPNWAYVVINDKPLYNATNSQDFELHASEEIELVYRILALAGVAIEKPQLTQLAGTAAAGQIQLEKQ